MPTPNTLIAPVEPTVLTEAQTTAKQVIGDSDLVLQRLLIEISAGFARLWGSKESPKSKDDAQAILDALGANALAVFDRHAKLLTFLITNNLASFEPWELVPPYEFTVEEGLVVLSDTLHADWAN